MAQDAYLASPFEYHFPLIVATYSEHLEQLLGASKEQGLRVTSAGEGQEIHTGRVLILLPLASPPHPSKFSTSRMW